MLELDQYKQVTQGYDADPARSLSLHASAYTDDAFVGADRSGIIAASWQWVCHEERLRDNGAYLSTNIAGNPVVLLRDHDGQLRGFYNVCQHRAMQLLEGAGQVGRITCPYHAWTYSLKGQLVAAPETGHLKDFDKSTICLKTIQVETFAHMVFVNLDAKAEPLNTSSGNLAGEIKRFAPDIGSLTFARRLDYRIQSNWKNVIDNFLECYHCPVAHRDFVSLVDMDTYQVTTHGIYSSHMAEAGKDSNSAYTVADASVRDHAVWWLWPNTCLMRYPGRGNLIVMQVIPDGVDHTLETYDFFLEDASPNAAEQEAITYLDEVLQAEDIWLVEQIQKGMATPAFQQGRIVHDPAGSGKSEHGVHHFHGLVLDAYRRLLDETACPAAGKTS